MKILLATITLALSCLVSLNVISQTTFTGAVNTDWEEPGNWTNGLPANGNDATIPSGLEAQISSYIEVNFDVFNYGTIYNIGIIDNYGTIDNDGQITNPGTIFNNGQITNNGTIFNNFSGAIDNYGTIDNCNGVWVGQLPFGNTFAVCGCTDPTACNYDVQATIDDGSCIPSGCTNISACNYDAAASCDDESCEFITCRGCTGLMACNYNPTATIDDGSCEYVSCAGCKAVNACNYDSTASIDDGSCDYSSCVGCTYPQAPEYNATATIDDGSCTFTFESSCPTDINGDLATNASDLLLFLGGFGGTCD